MTCSYHAYFPLGGYLILVTYLAIFKKEIKRYNWANFPFKHGICFEYALKGNLIRNTFASDSFSIFLLLNEWFSTVQIMLKKGTWFTFSCSLFIKLNMYSNPLGITPRSSCKKLSDSSGGPGMITDVNMKILQENYSMSYCYNPRQN